MGVTSEKAADEEKVSGILRTCCTFIIILARLVLISILFNIFY